MKVIKDITYGKRKEDKNSGEVSKKTMFFTEAV
jgi:hypothetical protein